MKRKKRQTNPNLALGYIRVSTEEQQLGPDAQERAIREFCSRHGLELAGCHRDIGLSGSLPLEKRRGLLAAYEGVQILGAESLVVARWDRLSRDAEYSRFLVRMFEASGVAIQSSDGLGNGVGPSDKFVRGILSEVAEFERGLTAARTRAALATKRARGERVGQIPYGQKLHEDGVHLSTCPEEQKVIAQILAWHRDERSPRWIAERLNKEGVPARGAKWYKTTVYNLIGAGDADTEIPERDLVHRGR